MGIVILVLTLLATGVVPAVAQEPPGSSHPLGSMPTSPAGARDKADGILDTLNARARSFRGNPLPLGVLTSVVLVTAGVLGVYTIRVADRDGAHQSGDA
jgi:hypothetical protein